MIGIEKFDKSLWKRYKRHVGKLGKQAGKHINLREHLAGLLEKEMGDYTHTAPASASERRDNGETAFINEIEGIPQDIDNRCAIIYAKIHKRYGRNASPDKRTIQKYAYFLLNKEAISIQEYNTLIGKAGCFAQTNRRTHYTAPATQTVNAFIPSKEANAERTLNFAEESEYQEYFLKLKSAIPIK